MKRCTHCDQIYELALEACPDCGYEGYIRVKTEQDGTALTFDTVVRRRCGEVVEASHVSCPKCNEALCTTGPGCFITFLLLLNLLLAFSFIVSIWDDWARRGFTALR